jgi:putative protease
MIEAGVTTFKIEGRLKDRDYVTNIVAYYRRLLDEIIASREDLEQASTPSVYEYNFTPNPQKTFHRGGTDYFLQGRRTKMGNWDTPKSTGEKIGKVIATRQNAICVQLLPGITLHNGDGLCYGDKGFAVNRIDGDWIYPNILSDNRYPIADSRLPKPGTTLYRNLDVDFVRSLQATRRMPVDVVFEAVAEGYRLTIGDQTATFVAEHQAANQTERALLTIQQQISKLGDTDFIARNICILNNGTECKHDFPYFIPTSQLNQWRRDVIASCSEASCRTSGPSYSAASCNEASCRTSGPSYSAASCNNASLMTCKYCILSELGHCRKINPMAKEPRYLRLQNGTILALEFDCKHCEMLIKKQH